VRPGPETSPQACSNDVFPRLPSGAEMIVPPAASTASVPDSEKITPDDQPGPRRRTADQLDYTASRYSLA